MKKHISLFLISMAILGLTIGLAKAADTKTYQGSITSINYNDATFILSSSPTAKVITNTNTKISFQSGSSTITKSFSNLKTGMVITVRGVSSISLSSNPATMVTASEIKYSGALTTTVKPLPTTNSTPASSVTTHNECRNNKCYKVTGSGDNECYVDSECQGQTASNTPNTYTTDVGSQSDNQKDALIKSLQEQVNALMAQLQILLSQQYQSFVTAPVVPTAPVTTAAPSATPTISITSPASNAQLTPGASQTITWQYTGDKNTVSKYTLYFYDNVNKKYILEQNFTDKNQNSYAWTIPNIPGTGHYFVVSAFTSAGRVDSGYLYVTITGTSATHKECQNLQCVSVSGTGTDSCQTDANCQTKYSCNSYGQCIINSNGQYTNMTDCINACTHKICSLTNQCIAVSGAGTNQCSVNADCVPAVHKACQNQRCVSVSGTGTDSCQTDANCVIPTISIISPNGGEQLQMGQTYNITWRSTGIANVMIELNKNNPNTSWHLIYSVPASAGLYSWVVPINSSTIVAGSDYKIKIWDTSNVAINSESANYFSISSNDSSYCQSKGGTWKQFTDGCVDSCSKVSNPSLACIQALTYGCDCGVSKCWDETTRNCVSNPVINPVSACSVTKPVYVTGETPSVTITSAHPWGVSSFMLKKDGVIKCVDQKNAGAPDYRTVIFGGPCMTYVASGTYGYGNFEVTGAYSGDPTWNCSFRYATSTTSLESDATSLKAQLLDLVRSLLEYIQNQ